MAVNWAFGMGIGLFCGALLLAFDVFDLRSLLWRSDIPLAGAAMLCAAFAFTFGGVVCAAAIMQLDDEDDSPRGRSLRSPHPRSAVAAPLAARAPRPTRDDPA